MKNHFEYVVIGAGGAGSSTAYQLAKRGAEVLLLEQFEVGHSRGSSHGHSRIFRYAYDHPDYVRLAKAAKWGWDEVSDEAGIPLLKQTGGLDIGPPESEGVKSVLASLRSQGAQVEVLDTLALAKRFPQWRIPEDWVALYSPDAGIVWPTQTVEVLVALAQTHGAEVREYTPVQKIEISGGHPLIHTSAGTISAGKVVVSAGAWLPKLVPQLKDRVEIALEATVFFRPKDLELFSTERFPIFITHGEDESYGFGVYGLPGIKIAVHHAGQSTTADSRGFEVSPEYIERLRRFIRQYLPQAEGPAFGGRTCIYTNTANKDFVIDSHPDLAKVIIASPCSGHGFKFVPVLGEIVADLAQGKKHPLWFERFKLATVA